MDNRRIEIARWPIPDTDMVNIATISYPLSSGLPKAYYLHVQPTTVTTYSDGTVICKYVPTDGYREFLEQATRYSAKRLDDLSHDPNVLAIAKLMHEFVLNNRSKSC